MSLGVMDISKSPLIKQKRDDVDKYHPQNF